MLEAGVSALNPEFSDRASNLLGTAIRETLHLSASSQPIIAHPRAKREQWRLRISRNLDMAGPCSDDRPA